MTPTEIHNKQFDKAMSGYRPDDVTAYLAEVANYVESIIEEKSELEQKLMVLAEKLEEYREDEDSLRAALIGAQKLGDSVVRESKRKAEQILSEAQQKADSVVVDIKQNIDRETETLNKMQAEVAKFKGQILAMYRQHIEMFNAIPFNEKDFAPQQKQAEPSSKAVPPAKPEPFKQQESPVKPAEASVKSADARAAAQKDFIVSFEDDIEEIEYEEIPEESPKKESRHGDLLFGERYPLTRKE